MSNCLPIESMVVLNVHPGSPLPMGTVPDPPHHSSTNAVSSGLRYSPLHSYVAEEVFSTWTTRGNGNLGACAMLRRKVCMSARKSTFITTCFFNEPRPVTV